MPRPAMSSSNSAFSKMSSLDKNDILLTISLIILAVAIALMGVIIGIKSNQINAVKNGMAHWKVNAYGETQFVWNTNLLVPEIITK